MRVKKKILNRMRNLFSLLFLFYILSAPSAFSWHGSSHEKMTAKALEILREIAPSLNSAFETHCRGRSATIEDIWRESEYSRHSGTPRDVVAKEAGRVDNYKDLEFIDVDGGRDNYPHSGRRDEIDDVPNRGTGHRIYTAFNHFIDIRKGPGIFDDYDGYSFMRGSGKDNWWGVDGLVALWFNDEYVHIPGQGEYNHCSRSIENYDYNPDVRNSRFPVVSDGSSRRRYPYYEGEDGEGYPWSVFMPVDNMARFWYREFMRTLDPATLGPIMHAFQDAGNPHHAAGFLGNRHEDYEDYVDGHIDEIINPRGFNDRVIRRVNEWLGGSVIEPRRDPSPPTSLRYERDRGRTPAINWPIDQLVTWLAFGAYDLYRGGNFELAWGLAWSIPDPTDRIIDCVAMSVFALIKTIKEAELLPPRITSITPSSVAQNTWTSITIRGEGFYPRTEVRLEPGIATMHMEIVAESEIRLSIRPDERVPLSVRSCTVKTHRGRAVGPFTVTPPPAIIRSVTPCSCYRGASADVIIEGENFQDIERVSFGEGILVSGVSLFAIRTGELAIRATVEVSREAPIGPRDVIVRQRLTEPRIGRGVFMVTEPPHAGPLITTVYPSSAMQGESLKVTIRGLGLTNVLGVNFGYESRIIVRSFREVEEVRGRYPYLEIYKPGNALEVFIKIPRNEPVGNKMVTVRTRGGGMANGVFRVETLLR